MHFSGKRNIEQIVSTPATTELQLTQQGWSILLLWFAIHQQKPPALLCTFETFSQTFAVSFLYFATFPPAQEHQSLSSPVLRTKRHVCRGDVKWGRCAVSVTHSLSYPCQNCHCCVGHSCPGAGWENRLRPGGHRELVLSEPAPSGVRDCWSLQSPQNLPQHQVPKWQEGYKQGCGCPNPLLPLPLSFKTKLCLSGAGVLLSPVYFLEFLSIYILEANPYQFLSTIPVLRFK